MESNPERPDQMEGLRKLAAARGIKPRTRKRALDRDLEPEEEKILEMIKDGSQADLLDEQKETQNAEWEKALGKEEKINPEQAKTEYDRNLIKEALGLEDSAKGCEALDAFLASTPYKRFVTALEKSSPLEYDALHAFNSDSAQVTVKFEQWKEHRHVGTILKEYTTDGKDVLRHALELYIEAEAPRLLLEQDQIKRIKNAGYLTSNTANIFENRILEKGSGIMWPEWFFNSSRKVAYGTDIVTQGLDVSNKGTDDQWPLTDRERTVMEFIFSDLVGNGYVDKTLLRTAGFTRALQSSPEYWAALKSRYDENTEVARAALADIEAGIEREMKKILTELSPLLSFLRGYFKERSAEGKDPYLDQSLIEYGFIPDEQGAYHEVGTSDEAIPYAQFEFKRGHEWVKNRELKETEEHKVLVVQSQQKQVAEARLQLVAIQIENQKKFEDIKDDFAKKYGHVRKVSAELAQWKQEREKMNFWERNLTNRSRRFQLDNNIPAREDGIRRQREELKRAGGVLEEQAEQFNQKFDLENYILELKASVDEFMGITDEEVNNIVKGRKKERVNLLLGE